MNYFSMFLNDYLIATFVYAIFLASLNETNAVSLLVGHYHHNKRQQQQLSPTLTLDVEPHPGIQPSSIHTSPIPEYYFPIDSGLLNFTCTIKHPSYKYKLTIIREQQFNNGERGAPLSMIDTNDYVLNPSINDPRMQIEYSEPTFDDSNAKYLRVSLYIKNLKLDDNGIYTCKYSTITKKINAIVYKPATQSLISLTPPSAKFYLNTPVNVTCRVNDVYPRPKVTFTHSSRNDLSESITEKDLSNVKETSYYSYTVASSIHFTPKYTDNNQDLNCSVTSHTSTNTTLFKTIHLSILGVQIIEELCNELQVTSIGTIDYKITCVFYSNPKAQISWDTSPEESSKNQLSEQSNVEQTGAESPDGNAVGSEDQETKEVIKIFDGDDTPAYHATVEDYGVPNSGLYRAVLRIKEVRPQDLKNYTFKLDKFERVIKLDKESELTKDLPIVELPSPSSSSSSNALASLLSHSKLNLALVLNLAAYKCIIF